MSESNVIEVPQNYSRREERSLPAQSNMTPMQMVALAVANGEPIEKLEKLMALQERWDANEARKAFVEAMAAFKANPPTILKGKDVDIPGGAKFAHATLAAVCDGVCVALSRHGLSHKWETSQADGFITVTCILTHKLGHSERTTLMAPPDDSGKKNRIQQVASTVTYLERYTLMAATGLAAKDMDDDGQKSAKEEVTPDPEGKIALETCGSLGTLQDAWKALTAQQRATLNSVKEDCKARIKEASK